VVQLLKAVAMVAVTITVALLTNLQAAMVNFKEHTHD
jgi:hypothetical protein